MGNAMPTMYYFKNETEMPIVVFCERGVLYCKQKLEPGEAVRFSRGQAGRFPFSICCSVGRELPSVHQSFTNFMKAATGPIVTILTVAETLTGGVATPVLGAAGVAVAGLNAFVTDNPQKLSYCQPHFGQNIISTEDEYYGFFGGGQNEIQLHRIDNVGGVNVLDAVM